MMFATELGVCPVKPQLSPDSSTANTHLCGRANCQAKWESRLILQGGLNYPAATEKLLSQLRYLQKRLCVNWGLTVPSHVGICTV